MPHVDAEPGGHTAVAVPEVSPTEWFSPSGACAPAVHDWLPGAYSG